MPKIIAPAVMLPTLAQIKYKINIGKMIPIEKTIRNTE